MSCPTTQTILKTECIGNSLVTINGNFNTLRTAICDNQTQIDDIKTAIGGNPSLNGIRLSYSSTTAAPISDIKNATTLYIHPYKGNTITLYNISTNKWDLYPISGINTSSLSTLLGNTNYDIYLFAQNGTFNVEYVAWPSSVAGDPAPARSYIDGVPVKPGEYNKRLIGCLRTTSAGQSEQSFGNNIEGGALPKQFLWNAQNQVPVSCYSFENGQYIVNGGSGGWTGWRRVNQGGPGAGFNNRFSFIIGDNVPVNMIAQVYASYYANLTQIVTYTALGINSDTSPTLGQGSQMVSELRGSDMTPRAQLLKTFSSGYHFCQMFENIYTGINTNVVMNENHQNQTGFLASIYN